MPNTNYIQHIAIVGASGNAGASTLKHLLAINPSIQITIISRADSTATFPKSSQVIVKKGSYDDPTFLQSAFEGSELAMFALSFTSGNVQDELMDAAAKAGVKWIVPNEFAGDGLNEKMLSSVTLFQPKAAARKHIEELAETYEGLKWIGVTTNPWTELSVVSGMFGFDVPNRTATLYEGAGEFNSSSMNQVGRGIAKVISLPIKNEENPRGSLNHYANNFAYISSYLISQPKLFASIKKATGTSDSDWKIEHLSIEERIRVSTVKFLAGDFMAGGGVAYAHYMGDGLGGNFEAKAAEDRRVLGLQEEDLDDIVKNAVEGGKWV